MAPARSATPPGYAAEVLANGLRVSVLADPAHTVVATQLWYHVGAAHEDAGSRGLAHLFEHLMFGPTTTRPAEDYAAFHHRHGGSENAYTSEDETVYHSEIAPAHHRGVLEREADRMRNLVLAEAALDNEKRIVLEELRLATENDPLSRLFVEATRRLMGDHPYARWPTGIPADIEAATVAACRGFYDRYYRPGNAHLVVVGPFDAPAKLAEIRELFGSIPPGGEPAPEVAPLHTWSFPAALDLEEDLPPVEVAVLGYPLPPPGGPEADALDLLAELLAGDQVDRVREILVERRGKAMEAGLEQLDYRMGGGLVFYSASLPYRREATAFRLLEETLAELGRLDWLTPDRLQSAQRARIRRAAGSTYTALGRAGDIGAAHWWLADERRAFDAIERIRAVTVADVEAVFRKYVTDARPIRLYVRPRRVPWYVAAFGWLAPLVGP